MIFDLVLAAAAGSSILPGGQVVYEATGTWVVPAGVTSICAVAVGSGNGDSGGNLSYKNNIPVTPGETLTVNVGGVVSSIYRGSTILLLSGSTNNGATAFVGGANGGAAGYAGNGGEIGQPAPQGSGGGGGPYPGVYYYGGGGVGLKGLGADGAAGTSGSPAGKGGSGGANGVANTFDISAAKYGGSAPYLAPSYSGNNGGVRIIWGAGRSYPYAAQDIVGTTMQAVYDIHPEVI